MLNKQDSLCNSQSSKALNLCTYSPAQSLSRSSAAQATAQCDKTYYLHLEEGHIIRSEQHIARTPFPNDWVTLNEECARLAAPHSTSVPATTPPCSSPFHAVVSNNLGALNEQASLCGSQSPQAINLSTYSPEQHLGSSSAAQAATKGETIQDSFGGGAKHTICAAHSSHTIPQ